jgi:drug/metabolite transporter (DMT)-like permease
MTGTGEVVVTTAPTTSVRPPLRRTVALTGTALVMFASNSILCRLALRHASIDAATFSTIRVLSGAALLLAVAAWRTQPLRPMAGSWTAASLLALYAVPFAFAYTQLSTGTGALILFGSVQVTMLGTALGSGERHRAAQWTGAGLALAGLVTLVFPGLTAPPLTAAVLMAVAGASWGIYSLRGRVRLDPLGQTMGNFVRAVPLVGAMSLVMLSRAHMEPRGILLAVASGALASGLGYAAWYAALRGLTSMHAAVLQLAVPILAAAGGVIFMAETVSVRLALSTVMVLGGIAVSILGGTSRGSR